MKFFIAVVLLAALAQSNAETDGGSGGDNPDLDYALQKLRDNIGGLDDADELIQNLRQSVSGDSLLGPLVPIVSFVLDLLDGFIDQKVGVGPLFNALEALGLVVSQDPEVVWKVVGAALKAVGGLIPPIVEGTSGVGR